MPKSFNWSINSTDNRESFEVEAATREDAIAKAEANYLWLTDELQELVGTIDPETNELFVRPPIPDYNAKRIRA